MLLAHPASIALTAVAFAASGCGGSSTSTQTTTVASTQPAATTTAQSTATTPVVTTHATTVKLATGTPLTRAAFIAKGEAICARTNAELSSSVVKSHQDLLRVLPQAAIYDKTEAQELSRLVPPSALAQSWTQIVNDFQRFGEYSDRVAEYARANDRKSQQSLTTTAEKLHEKVAALAKRDGFNECAQI